jgi:glycosyltransferase involved in cell wall biosynthesis
MAQATLDPKAGVSVPPGEDTNLRVERGDANTYSVCMLCSNDLKTVEASIHSVLGLAKYRKLEVVVVDNLSRDGSADILSRLKSTGQIALVEQKCTRGEGRQIAFGASKGEYVLSHMDCDDIFDPVGLDSLISRYHAEYEGRAMMTKRRDSPEASNITIAPRSVLESVGGWRPLNWGEDWDLWARLASRGLYSFLPYPLNNPPHTSIKVRVERFSGPSRGFWVRVSKYSDAVRTGRKVFDSGEQVSTVQRLALAVARIRVSLGGALPPVPDPDFSEEVSTTSKAPRYSVCMTCYNEAPSVKDSLNSLLKQLNEDFEVVVVDNFSEDGTFEILKEFERSHRLKAIQRRCSRGLGRQIAFENSAGEYVIANLDLDDIFLPVIGEVLDTYHQNVEGELLAVFNTAPPPDLTYAWVQNITIAPRKLLVSLGGWRDVNIFEDWDLWSRASKAGRYHWTTHAFAKNVTYNPESRAATKRLGKRYERYLIRLRLGMRIFTPGEKKGPSQRMAYLLAKLALPFKGVLGGQDPLFQSLDMKYYVELDNRIGRRGVGES